MCVCVSSAPKEDEVESTSLFYSLTSFLPSFLPSSADLLRAACQDVKIAPDNKDQLVKKGEKSGKL